MTPVTSATAAMLATTPAAGRRATEQATHLHIMRQPIATMRSAGAGLLANGLDDLDQLVQAVAVTARQLDKIASAFDDGALLGGSDDGDAASAPELEEALVAQGTQCAEDGVRVDTENGGQVLRRRRRSPGLASPSEMAGGSRRRSARRGASSSDDRACV